jgi:hypothetical protein
MTEHPHDFDLLRLHIEASLDDRRRVLGLCGIKVASAEDGQSLWVGADVPDELALGLKAVFEHAPASRRADQWSLELERYEPLLTAGCGPMLREAGPYYLVGPDVRFSSDVRIERSDAPRGEGLRGSNPGNWHPVEWDELLDGQLGPWAMATEDHRVISICHTPSPMNERTAECGVWTDPEFRGRGHAAAVTSEWAAVLRPSGRYLFYSTDADNLSSQRVAQRLKLRPLGWIGRLRQAGRTDQQFHPLSQLSR